MVQQQRQRQGDFDGSASTMSLGAAGERSQSRPSSPKGSALRSLQAQHAFLRMPSNQLIAQVYEDNQRKSRKSAQPLLPPLQALSIADDDNTNDASETNFNKKYEFYQQNIDRHQSFKHRLMRQLHGRRQREQEKSKQLSENYWDLYETWETKIAKWEHIQRKKQMKILQKHRENMANNPLAASEFKRNSRSNPGAAAPPNPDSNAGAFPGGNEYNPDFIPYNFPATEDDFRYLKTLIPAPPPMILGRRERANIRYIDNTRLLDDGPHSARTKMQLNPWTDEEKKAFAMHYLNYPKEFGKIASLIPNKSSQDCVS
jgi:hypothetical protein